MLSFVYLAVFVWSHEDAYDRCWATPPGEPQLREAQLDGGLLPWRWICTRHYVNGTSRTFPL